MRSVDSAIAMNSAGEIEPCVGWNQRTSASTLSTMPLRRFTCGWKCSSSWPPAMAERSSPPMASLRTEFSSCAAS